MNAEHILRLIHRIIRADRTSKVTPSLETVAAAYLQLQAGPGHKPYADAATKAVSDLVAASNDMAAKLNDPDGLEAQRTLGADKWIEGLSTEVTQIIEQNAAAPSTIASRLEQLTVKRAAYMNSLKATRGLFEVIGIAEDQPSAGSAELGVVFPRAMFGNSLKGLIHELKQMEFVFRTYSEFTGKGGVDAQVGAISTSNPLFHFGLDPQTIHAVLHGMEFAIQAVNSLSEVRRAIAVLRRSVPGAHLDEAAASTNASLKALINEEVTRNFAGRAEAADGRERELHAHIAKSLQKLVEFVEAGGTVHVRLGSPEKTEQSAVSDEMLKSLQADFERLNFPLVVDPSAPRLIHDGDE